MTGVFVFATGASLLLQPLKNSRLPRRSFPQRRRAAREDQGKIFAPSRLCGRISLDLFFMILLGQWFAGHTIFAFDPLTQVDELTPLRTEGTKRIIFPLD
jgi:hypothetical protein